MRRLLREPLLHFFVLGALLFGVYALLQRGASDEPTEITVTRGQLMNLQAQFEKVWQRAPTREELDGLVENWVREEVFYREGLAMGLDRDDPVVRRRIGQKMEFIVDSAIPVAPTDAQLQEWLDQHAEKYSLEPRYSLRQVYFDPGKHGERLDSVIATARRTLASGGHASGDATMLPPELIAAEASQVERTFGGQFAAALEAVAIGEWQGPVRSGFGLHLVVVSERTAPRLPALEEVRTAVERDFLHERTQAANDAVYRRLRHNYSVRIETS